MFAPPVKSRKYGNQHKQQKSLQKKEAARVTAPRKKAEANKDLAETHNQYKKFEGKQYTGMKVGRSHKWYYDKGHVPEGSGVPVGTGYHWYILAHQHVRNRMPTNTPLR